MRKEDIMEIWVKKDNLHMNNKQISGKLYTHLDHMEKSIEVRITQKMEKR